MRNPFKTVYCDDCEHCKLATHHNDTEKHLVYAKCKAKPKTATRKYVSTTPEPIDYKYCAQREAPFCFKFKAKE